MFNSIEFPDVNNAVLQEINGRLLNMALDQEAGLKVMLESNSKTEQSLSELKDIVVKLQSEVRDIRMELDQKLNKVGTRIDDIGASVKKSNHGSFVWQIDNLAHQQSDAFYTHENGYKMRLQLTPERYWIRNGILLVVKMVHGANDKQLQWPVEFDIRVGIVNQENGQFFRSEKQIILFKNSIATHESPFKFTPYDLSGSAWKNKCLIIKCLVN